jgi:hypothetical protein
MKKILTLALCLLLSSTGYSTHLMGGEMTVEHWNGVNYIIHLTAYRDTIGIPFATTATFEIYDNTNTMVLSSTVPQDPSSGALMPGYPYGVEVYTFHDTIVVPGPGEYEVRWLNCCRNAAIQNLTAPLSENMFLSTTFTHFPPTVTASSTPTFLAPPVTYLPINQPWQYNSLPFDIDGDSLAWSIDTPYTDYGVLTGGWVTPSANASGPFVIDNITGQIDWTPDMLGNFVASILVEEFRNGTKIGEIRRDYQMIVIPDTTKSPRISNFNVFPKNANGHAYMNLLPNKPVNVVMLAEDPEGDQVEFLAFGEPFLLNNNNATFTTQPYNGTDVQGSFNWMPNASQARTSPYIVVFRTRDAIFSFDETVLFYVDPITTGINSIDAGGLGDVYPNPATNLIFIPLSLESSARVDIVLYDITGKKLNSFNYGELPSGDHQKQLQLEVSSGTYFLTLFVNGKQSATRKIMIK